MGLTVVPAIAGVLGIFGVLLAFRVIGQRRAAGVSVGFGDNLALEEAGRVFGNFVEYVPLALVLMLTFELTGASNTTLHVYGGILIVARVLHAFGLKADKGATPGRFLGTIATFGVIVGMSGQLLWGAVQAL